MQKICPSCGASFTCRTEPGCWCADLPHLLPIPDVPNQGCLCPTCLQEKLRSAAAPLQVPEIKAANK